MKRRTVFGGIAAIAGAPMLGVMADAAVAAPGKPPLGGPPNVTPDDLTFHPRTLRTGSAAEAGLTKQYVKKIVPDAASFMEPGPDGENPSHPGFVVLAARKGVIVAHEAGGYALRYKSYDPDTDTAVDLPKDKQVAMPTDAIFDMASVSKLFTSMVATQLAAEHKLDLTAEVRSYIPDFAGSDSAKAPITLMHLLRHVSGLKASINLYELPNDAARMQAIYDSELQSEPGKVYEYSDLNLITLAHILTEITGKTLDKQVASRITEPLGMSDTGYNPPKSKLDRIAATEYKPDLDRGMIRGVVHDENAWGFGGVAGHAGVFSTAADMAIFGQMILNGGTYNGVRLLDESWVRALLTNYSPDLPNEAARGLGWQLDQRFYMDAMTSPVAAGHTGFTGTCLVIDPLAESVYVLLTNRVHPTRNWGATSEYRQLPARDIARAVPVHAKAGKTAWFAGQSDATQATLTLPLGGVVDDGAISFGLWYDTDAAQDDDEAIDFAQLSASADGKEWKAVSVELSCGHHRWSTSKFSGFQGRQWLKAEATLPDGTKSLQWSYSTNAELQGRGVYVDKVKIYAGHRKIFDGEHHGDAARFEPEGWDKASD